MVGTDMYVMGGADRNQSYVSSIYRLDTAKLAWSVPVDLTYPTHAQFFLCFHPLPRPTIFNIALLGQILFPESTSIFNQNFFMQTGARFRQLARLPNQDPATLQENGKYALATVNRIKSTLFRRNKLAFHHSRTLLATNHV